MSRLMHPYRWLRERESQALVPEPLISRDFTVAVFVVSCGCVLLHYHRKLDMWLPPGGHIECGELPDDAAVREVFEETGVEIRLVGGHALPVAYPRQLTLPQGIQLEDISPGHQHIDLVYFGEPQSPLPTIDPTFSDRDRVKWYPRVELDELGVNEEILLWCEKALAYFGFTSPEESWTDRSGRNA
jgi:ADP-ribose pyrophosphatase YjhB (NUDIX family)